LGKSFGQDLRDDLIRIDNKFFKFGIPTNRDCCLHKGSSIVKKHQKRG